MLAAVLFRRKTRDAVATMQAPKPPPPTFNPSPPGLKTLTLEADPLLDRHCLKRGTVSSPTSSLSRASSVNSVRDTEEEEEEVDDADSPDDDELDNGCWGLYGWRRRPYRFPPPIPLLARTANLASRMPWVLKRIYKDDGSLVIQQVRVKHHEYFRARREGGRLTLRHVYLDVNPPLLNERTMAGVDPQLEHPAALVSQPWQIIPPLRTAREEEGGEVTESTAWLPEIRCAVVREEIGDYQSRTPRVVRSSLMELSSMMELSSSMPEPLFREVRRGCFEHAESGLMCRIPRMRTVHS